MDPKKKILEEYLQQTRQKGWAQTQTQQQDFVVDLSGKLDFASKDPMHGEAVMVLQGVLKLPKICEIVVVLNLRSKLLTETCVTKRIEEMDLW